MPLPMSKRVNEWEIEGLFDKPDYDTNRLKQENPNLYKLILISLSYEQEEIHNSYDLGASVLYSLLLEASKPNKLPVVSDATVDSTIVSFFSSGDRKEKATETYREMFKDESLLLCLLWVISSEKFSDLEKDWICKGFAQFYELLSRQLEAIEMEEMFS